MRTLTAAGLVVWLLCAGCDNQPTNSSATQAVEESLADNGPLGTEESRTGKVAAERDGGTNDAQPVDYGNWLSPPEGVNSRIAEIYPSLVRQAESGDAESLAKLVEVSQQIALQAANRGEEDTAYAFFGQAGEALRSAMEAGIQVRDESLASNVFYNEACALVHAGDIDAAAGAVSDAVRYGFNNFELLASDTDMVSLRKSAGYAGKLADWKRIAAEKLRELALRDLEDGQSFPFEFVGQDIEGNEHSLQELRGNVVLVDVWGTWCPPCRAEVPSLIKLQDRFADQGLQIIGLNYERGSSDEANLRAVVNFVNAKGINYPCIMGDRQTQSQIPNFRGYPTKLFIDRSGAVRMLAVGGKELAYLEAVVSVLLAESAPPVEEQAGG